MILIVNQMLQQLRATFVYLVTEHLTAVPAQSHVMTDVTHCLDLVLQQYLTATGTFMYATRHLNGADSSYTTLLGNVIMPRP